MTKLEFIAKCGKYLICPDIALENENVLDAIHTNDIEKLAKVLETEF